MRRIFSTIILVMLASLVMAQAPVISRKKSQDQPTTTSNKPSQKKPATQPTTPRRPTTGVLTITSTPSDASVKLDNDYLGTTPITIRQQRAGSYTITFSAEGYETRTKNVTVTAGETTTCSATLVKKGQTAPTIPTTPTATTSMRSNGREQTFTIKGVSFKMILVDGGTLSPYYIGETEVTQALWNTLMSDNPSTHKGDQLPVADVSWNTCQEFIRKLSSTLNAQFRLPSDAEWEYAAKGGSKGHGYTYPGSNNLDEVAWYYYNSGDKRISGEWDYSLATDNHNKPHAVKTKKPNELGLYDMAGNVHEWCHNAGDTSGGSHSMRGGGWSNDPSECAIRAREVKESSHTGWNTGLRLAMTAGATSTATTPTSQPSFAGMTSEEIGKKGRELYNEDKFSEALPYVYEAALQGYLDAEYLMGLMSYYGEGVVTDYDQAVYWFRKAADNGGINSSYYLGLCYELGRGVGQSWTDAVYWYRKAADDDCGNAQVNLGLCYENGTGVSQDWTEAVKWYRKAADNDVSSGQMHLGYCYYNGNGIAQDYDQAVYWYRKAADKGNSAAMNNLGVCYARGNGVTQDYVESAAWYRKAADSGNATAQNNLGDCYYDGKGVTKDYEQAVYWYRKAVANGNRSAHYNLGWCYYFGQGVTEDKQEAYRLMKLASDQGHENAKKFIDEHSFTASASGQQPVQQSSVSSGLPATITVEYLINHPLCYFNSWNIDITFQQAYSQISREHPEWVLDNYKQKNEHLWIDGGLNVYYLGVKIKRYTAYWSGTKKLVSHAFYLQDMTASKSDDVLAVILKELSKLGYSMSRSRGTYTTDYVGTVGGIEVKVEQWNEHGKDIEISVNYRSLKR